VDKQYNDVTIALLDDAGCARIEQVLRGSFQDPVIDKPNVLRSLAGPVRALLQKLVPPDACEPFYPVVADSMTQ
jgi:AsmA protein